MTLYNKDGSVYKLSSPNRLMRTQTLWEKDHIFYNLDWLGKFEQILFEINKKLKKIEAEEQGFLYQEVEAKEEIEENSIEEVQIEEEILVKEEPSLEEIFFSKEEPKKETIVEEKPKSVPKLSSELDKTFVFCLPAFYEDRKDDLYGDTYKSLKYGNAFSMEAVIISQNDLCLEIWTNVESIEKGSVLYPKTGFKRWWKVQQKKPKAQGWVLTMIPSDFHPSFDGI
ncbi:MAG: hypothetical protein EKK64_09855 [Neisseriaceae bacterium]|nr:MAG: hypothetical protein EKK64_09855 [Neisseriaceae bacterium]